MSDNRSWAERFAALSKVEKLRSLSISIFWLDVVLILISYSAWTIWIIFVFGPFAMLAPLRQVCHLMAQRWDRWERIRALLFGCAFFCLGLSLILSFLFDYIFTDFSPLALPFFMLGVRCAGAALGTVFAALLCILVDLWRRRFALQTWGALVVSALALTLFQRGEDPGLLVWGLLIYTGFPFGLVWGGLLMLWIDQVRASYLGKEIR